MVNFRRQQEFKDIELHTRALVESVKNILRDEKQVANQKIHEVSDVARTKYEEGYEYAGEKGKEVDAYARDNVWKSIGIAALVGAVLALLFGRNHKDRY